MATQKQMDANRANSQKSTGPRTPEGKAASSLNALKSGIDAKSQIVTGEKAANLETLKDEYYAHFRPTNPIQRMLVDTLIDSEWLLRRFRVVEAQLWEGGSRKIGCGDDDVALGKAFDFKDVVFGRLQRRVNTALKNYYNALKELRLLQAEMPAPAPQTEPDPAPAPAQQPEPSRNQSVKPQNGFVPQPVVADTSSPAFPPDTR